MLFENARAEVRERLGESQADFWSDSFINRQLNEGIRRFCYEERWTWLLAIQRNIPVAAGNSELELIDDVDANRHFTLVLRPAGDNTDTQLAFPKRVPPDVGYRLRLRYSARGTPLYYYMSHVQENTYPDGDRAPALIAHLVPTPEKGYTAEYVFYKHPKDFADGQDISGLIPRQYVEAPIAWATAMCWLKELNGSGKAQEQFNIYNAILAQARKNEKELSVDEPLIWGGEEPQLQRRTLEEALLARIGPLGW